MWFLNTDLLYGLKGTYRNRHQFLSFLYNFFYVWSPIMSWYLCLNTIIYGNFFKNDFFSNRMQLYQSVNIVKTHNVGAIWLYSQIEFSQLSNYENTLIQLVINFTSARYSAPQRKSTNPPSVLQELRLCSQIQNTLWPQCSSILIFIATYFCFNFLQNKKRNFGSGPPLWQLWSLDDAIIFAQMIVLS